MTTSEATKPTDASLASDLLRAAWSYLRGRRGLVILAIIAITGGMALNWSWLVAVGIAPILLTVLPCLVMCGLGLCMNKLVGGSCAPQSTQSGRTQQPLGSSNGLNLSTKPDAALERFSHGNGSADAKASVAMNQTQPQERS